MNVSDEVIKDVVDAFDGYCAADVAPALGCAEVNALARLFVEVGRAELAQEWLLSHAAADDSGDEHYHLRKFHLRKFSD